MSDQKYNKSGDPIRRVISKGKVEVLRKKYEGLGSSKSEWFLTLDEYGQEDCVIDSSEEQDSQIFDLNFSFQKNVCHLSHSDTEPNKKLNKNTPIPSPTKKKPLPTPRASYKMKIDQKTVEDIIYENVGRNIHKNDLLLNSSFIEAEKIGETEKLRSYLLNLMDEKFDEMKINGYEDIIMRTCDSRKNFNMNISDEEATIYENIEELKKSTPKIIQKKSKYSSECCGTEELDNLELNIEKNFDEKDVFNWLSLPEPNVVLKSEQGIETCTDDENDSYGEDREELVQHEGYAENILLRKIVEDLKNTEIRYLSELKEIIPVLKFGVKNHYSLSIKTKAELICAGVDKLLDYQVQFAEALKEIETSIDDLLRIFIDYEKLFVTYKQCLGYSDSIIIKIGYDEDNFRKDINLSSVLNQRLTHYKMFLERIKKEVSRYQDSAIYQAASVSLNSVMEILNNCNTMLTLARIRNLPLTTNKYGGLEDLREVPSALAIKCCPSEVKCYGDFLLKDKFKITSPMSMTLTVFLFRNVIIFTKEIKPDERYFQGYIKMDDIGIVESNKKSILKLKHNSKSRMFHSPIIYSLKANEKIVEQWRKKILDCLVKT